MTNNNYRKRLSYTLYIDAPNDIKTIFNKVAQSITLIHQPHDDTTAIPIETYHYDQNGKLTNHTTHTEVHHD
jgi:hypothetical protein